MAKRRPPTVHGLALIDKPAGMTSHDVVSRLRKQLNERRIGHAGTLDPDATGVMVVGVGYVTRLMQFLSGMDKTYTCEVVFGSETNTLDDSGTVTATFEMGELTLDAVRAAAAKLTGPIMQVPPMVSALKFFIACPSCKTLSGVSRSSVMTFFSAAFKMFVATRGLVRDLSSAFRIMRRMKSCWRAIRPQSDDWSVRHFFNVESYQR